MTKTFCDGCRKEVPVVRYRLDKEHGMRSPMSQAVSVPPPLVVKELCDTCGNMLKQDFEMFNVGGREK